MVSSHQNVTYLRHATHSWVLVYAKKLHVPTHAVACMKYEAMASQVCQQRSAVCDVTA